MRNKKFKLSPKNMIYSGKLTRKKYIIYLLMSIIIISSALTVACGNQATKDIETSQLEQLYELRGTYIGDNSKVINILSLLDFPEGLTYDGIELFTKEEPFGLKINFKASDDVLGSKYWSKDSDHVWISPSVILFVLIDNLDYIQYTIAGDNLLSSLTHTDRKSSDTLTMSTLGYKTSEVAKNKELFEEFYNTYSRDDVSLSQKIQITCC